MRRILAVALSSTLCLAGCSSSNCSTGWRFEVLKPPTVSGTSLVASGPAPLGVAGLGMGAVTHEVAAVARLEPPPDVVPSFSRRSVAPLASCTLEDACRRLDALERLFREQMQSSRERLPMPKSPQE